MHTFVGNPRKVSSVAQMQLMGSRRELFRPGMRSIIGVDRLEFRNHTALIIRNLGKQRDAAIDFRWRANLRSRVEWQLERHVQVTILQDRATLPRI